MAPRIEMLKRFPLALLLLTVAACSGDGPSAPGTPTDADPLLIEVTPAGGTTGIGLDGVVTLEFDHAMDPAMSSYADMHDGDLAGPEVPGTWDWLADHTVLRFTPAGGFEPATTYTIHVGGGMMDADGHVVALEPHGGEMGGEWATDAMMGMGGGTGGHMDPADHMGAAWDHPSNGSHGMIFTFSTGS